jgi:hypothetical protein
MLSMAGHNRACVCLRRFDTFKFVIRKNEDMTSFFRLLSVLPAGPFT